MKSNLVLLTCFVVIISLWACNTETSKTSETNNVLTTSETNSTVGSYSLISSRYQNALSIPGVPISRSIKAQVYKNQQKKNLANNTTITDKQTQGYSAQDIPGVYLSKPIKTRLLNNGQDNAPVFHASANNTAE